MSDQGSTYAVLQSVPVMISPQYRLPKKIMVSSELKMVPDDIKKLPAYPFAVERDVIAQVEAARKQTFEAEEAFKLLKKQYQEEKLNQRKAAARKIAPGFLDTDTRILKPEQTYVQEFPMHPNNTSTEDEAASSNTSPHTLQPYVNYDKAFTAESGPDKQFDYHKFEQGLAPADPWDTPENDMVALRSILSSPKTDYNANRASTPASYPPQQYQAQPQQQQQHHQQQHQQQHQHQQQPTQAARPYQKNEGVYWNFQGNNNGNMYPPQQRQMHSTSSVPALPPKLFGNSSNSSSPVISPPPPVLPPPSDYHKSNTTPTPPPLPPLPITPNENLITELGNMGFSRAQAIDALEKNDHDLIKATNFLLDQA